MCAGPEVASRTAPTKQKRNVIASQFVGRSEVVTSVAPLTHPFFDFRAGGSTNAVGNNVGCLLGLVVRAVAWLHQQNQPRRVDSDPGELDQRERIEAFRHELNEQEIGGRHQVQQAGEHSH